MYLLYTILGTCQGFNLSTCYLSTCYNTPMLVDNIKLTVIAGKGGDGSAHFRRDAITRNGGPDGGNGGNGGNIYFQASHNVRDLREFRYKKKIEASRGIDGKGQKMFGKNAPHLTITVPPGTRMTDMATGEVFEMTDTTTPRLLAQGGRGGRGNTEFKTATNQSPHDAEKGGEGQRRELFLELWLIADIGLVGLPNAGKSSLLGALTRARPKVGSYPFTTLEPTIGMLGALAIADIPGLIAGASEGKGLGIGFLRHIEKTKIILHLIDLTDPSPMKSYETIRSELGAFSPALLTKPEIILLTKTDLVSPGVIRKARVLFIKKGKKVLACSIYDHKSITRLKSDILRA